MKTLEKRLSNIDWEYDSELLDINETEYDEEHYGDERYISFTYRGKELIADVVFNIDFKHHYVPETYLNPPDHWVEIGFVEVTLGEVTDLDEEVFHLSKEAIKEIEKELMLDLQTEF